MCSTDIICPICGETHLRRINTSGGKQEKKGHSRSANTGSFYICFRCKMTFFEEDLLNKQRHGLG